MTTAKTPVLGTGLHGLVGSRIVQDFADFYDFQNLDINHPTTPIDITQFDQVQKVFAESSAQVVVHCAAFTDVTKAWEQRNDKNGAAYKVNVLGTQHIANAAAQTGKHLIHISTAYVFDGAKSSLYTEKDAMMPIEWYGQTKAWAEEAVAQSGAKYTILRIDQPFRPDVFARADIAHRIIAGLKAGTLYPQFTNHFFGPTYIPDFAKVIDWVIRTGTQGLFHATTGEQWSDFAFANLIRQTLQLQTPIVAGDLEEYIKKTVRPYQRNTALDCSKLRQVIDFAPLSVREAISALHV